MNGLVDFSLRRAARAAGTTHKVLLYYFDGADDLLLQAVLQLRERRIDRALAGAAAPGPAPQALADRIRGVWAALESEESRALDQAIGLTMYDPARYARLGATASERYLPGLISICPPEWSEQRKREVAEMIMAAMRGFIVEWLTSGNTSGIEAGFAALARALDREEAAGA